MHIKISHSRIFIALTLCKREKNIFQEIELMKKKKIRQKSLDGNINILTGIQIMIIILSN